MGLTNTLLDPILNPLLGFGSFWAIFIIGFIVSLIVTLAYKFFTDQNKLKEIRAKNKEEQKKLKEFKDQPDVVMRIQKEMMSRNFESMKMSIKPTLFTFLPILIIFGWLNGHLLYDPISPGDIFTLQAEFAEGITGFATVDVPSQFKIIGDTNKTIAQNTASWQIQAKKNGDFLVDVQYEDQVASKQVVVTDELNYASQREKASGVIKTVSIEYEKLKPLGDFSIFGWRPGWLGWYIILSLVFSLVLRKLFGLQ